MKATYSYLADGTKVGVFNTANNTGYDYMGSLIYKRNGSTRTLDNVLFRDGLMIAQNNNTFTTYYHIKDHLGSIRSVIDNTGAVVEQNDYYPFGVRHDVLTQINNRYKFSGKEIQTMAHGSFDYLDFGARMYDPVLGRWSSVDPLAEKYYGISSYAYCVNNPVRFIDPNGMDWYEHDDGTVMWINEENERMRKQVDGWKHLGDTYKGFKVTVYKPTNYDHRTGHYSELEIKISYDGGEEGSEHAWTQVVRVNPAVDTDNGFERGEEFVDFLRTHEDYYPLYNGSFSDNKLEFYDGPYSRNRRTHEFIGEVSLFKRDKTNWADWKNWKKQPNSTTRVATFQWGYSVKDGVIKVEPIKVVNPSPLMLQTIDIIKRK